MGLTPLPAGHPASDGNSIEQADATAAEAAAPLRETLAVRVVGAVSELADQPPLITFTATILGLGLIAGDRRTIRAGGRMLAAELLATWIKTRIKRRVDRTRPYLLVDEGRYEMAPGSTRGRDASSFPSGHTAGAVAVARALVREVPAARATAYAAAALTAGVQIPRCAHYPSDIAAGAVVGLLAEAVVDGAVRVGEALLARR